MQATLETKVKFFTTHLQATCYMLQAEKRRNVSMALPWKLMTPWRLRRVIFVLARSAFIVLWQLLGRCDTGNPTWPHSLHCVAAMYPQGGPAADSGARRHGDCHLFLGWGRLPVFKALPELGTTNLASQSGFGCCWNTLRRKPSPAGHYFVAK